MWFSFADCRGSSRKLLFIALAKVHGIYTILPLSWLNSSYQLSCLNEKTIKEGQGSKSFYMIKIRTL